MLNFDSTQSIGITNRNSIAIIRMLFSNSSQHTRVYALGDDAIGLKARPVDNSFAIFSGVCGSSPAKNEISCITLAHFITHLHARGRSDASVRVSVHSDIVVTCKGVSQPGEGRPSGVTAVIFNPLCREGRD